MFTAQMRRNALIGLAVLGLVVAVVWFGIGGTGSSSGLSDQQTASADENLSSQHQPAAVAALARIEPSSEIIDVAAAIIDSVKLLNVKEGETVKEGQTLAFLDSFDERRAERDHVAAKLAEAERLLAAEKEVGASRIAAAEIRLHRAQSIYPLRIEAEKARVRSIEATLANNRDILETRSKLKLKNFSSRRAVDNQMTTVRQSEEDLITARVEVKRLEFEFEVDRREALNARVQAEADLARASAAVGLEALRYQLASAEQGVQRAIVQAPITGQILEILIRPGERTETKPILKMGDTRLMHAVAEIYETEIKYVKLGQPARVESSALTRPLTGRVVDINRIISKNDVLDVDPAADADARIVEVRIELEPDALVSRLTNLTVDAMIDVSAGEIQEVTKGSAAPK